MNRLILGFVGALVVAGSVQAQTTKRIEVPIDFPAFDSTTVLVANALATSQINDSIFFFSSPFSCDEPYTNIIVDFVKTIKDTATATGTARDSVTFYLQTKLPSDTVKIWRTLTATTKWPMASWDSTGLATVKAIHGGSDAGTPQKSYPSPTSAATGAATGIGYPYRGGSVTRISISDADSVAASSNLFRIMVMYNAEEDSLKKHCSYKSSTTIDILDKFVAYVKFKTR